MPFSITISKAQASANKVLRYYKLKIDTPTDRLSTMIYIN